MGQDSLRHHCIEMLLDNIVGVGLGKLQVLQVCRLVRYRRTP